MNGFQKIFWLLVMLVLASTARAHDPGMSSVKFGRTNGGVEIQMAFAWTDLARLVDGSPAARPNAAQLTALAPALTHATDGFACMATNGKIVTATAPVISPDRATATDVLVRIELAQITAGPLDAEFPVLSRMAFGHRMIVTQGQAAEAVALLDARHPTWRIPGASDFGAAMETEVAPAPARASWASFIPLGIEHILTGYDHLCFLLALLLVALRIRDVLAVVTTFTIAHSLTLAAAAMGTVSLPSSVVEPLIAASIVYIGVENLILRRQPRYRLALVFCFGLIHGLGFATALSERLPGITGVAVIPPLLSFNLGVEIGQLAVAACLIPLIKWARSRADYTPRLQPATSLIIAAVGAFWFVQRVWPV